MAECWICQPEIVTAEGADHIGMDAFMRCPRCGRQTTNHVECVTVTERVERVLRSEWKAGRTAPSHHQGGGDV